MIILLINPVTIGIMVGFFCSDVTAPVGNFEAPAAIEQAVEGTMLWSL